jgi:hypothetical protein
MILETALAFRYHIGVVVMKFPEISQIGLRTLEQRA